MLGIQRRVAKQARIAEAELRGARRVLGVRNRILRLRRLRLGRLHGLSRLFLAAQLIDRLAGRFRSRLKRFVLSRLRRFLRDLLRLLQHDGRFLRALGLCQRHGDVAQRAGDRQNQAQQQRQTTIELVHVLLPLTGSSRL